MENRFENNPPEERQDWGAYLKPPSYSGPPNSNALDAHVQNLCARVQEMRSRVVEAEAQIPMAMAEAFRSGNLGIMDYYRMRNVQADTSMRENIARPPQSGPTTNPVG